MKKLILLYLLCFTVSTQAQPTIDLSTIVEISNVTASISKDSSIVVMQLNDPEIALTYVCAKISDVMFKPTDNPEVKKLRLRVAMTEMWITKRGEYYYFNKEKIYTITKLRCQVRAYLRKKLLLKE